MANYFATASSKNINVASLWNRLPTSGAGQDLTWPPVNGDTLCANGKTALAINVDIPYGVTLTTGTGIIGSGTTGGGFTVTTASASRTISGNIVAGTTTCVAATLHATNVLYCYGSKISGSPTTNSIYALQHSATAGGMLVLGSAAYPVIVYGSSFASATASYGYYDSATLGTPPATWYCSFVGDKGPAAFVSMSSAATQVTCTGNMSGGSNYALSLILGRLRWGGPITQMAGGPFPFYNNGVFQWDSADGTPITLYDPSAVAHILKVPQYPDTGNVWWGTGTYDWGNLTPGKRGSSVVSAANLSYGVICDDVTGTLIIPGQAYGSGVLSKEIGANANGGTGVCAKFVPSSTSATGFLNLYVPVNSGVICTPKFYAKATAGFNGTFKVSSYDTDGTLENGSQNFTSSLSTSYTQMTCSGITPSNTGCSLLRFEFVQGAHATTDAIYIDDITVT